MAAKVNDLVLTVTQATMTRTGTMMVGGDCYVMAKGRKKVSGHFFQVLKDHFLMEGERFLDPRHGKKMGFQ